MKVNEINLKKILTGLFLFILGLGLSCIYFFNSDVNPNVISHDHQIRNLTQDNKGIRGEFRSADNYLGILTIRFDNKEIIEKKSVFRIKEKSKKNWYHISRIDAVQYNIEPVYSFGFPIIVGSKNKTYQFEVTLPDYVSGSPYLTLSTHEPIITSRYIYPWKAFLSNQAVFFNFLKHKIYYQLQNTYSPLVLFSYMIPLIEYMLYIFILHKYIPITINAGFITLMAFFGICIDIFILRNNYYLFILMSSLLWIGGIFFYRMRPQISIVASIILLVWCPFFLSAHMEWVVEKSANWVYILATIGFLQYFFQQIINYEK